MQLGKLGRIETCFMVKIGKIELFLDFYSNSPCFNLIYGRGPLLLILRFLNIQMNLSLSFFRGFPPIAV
jgi:hypothetical protein